jgi:hypothetical protein
MQPQTQHALPHIAAWLCETLVHFAALLPKSGRERQAHIDGERHMHIVYTLLLLR